MKITFLWVGKTRDARIRELEQEYMKRVSHYYTCDVTVSKPAEVGADSERIRREGSEIRAKLSKGAYTVALDPAGRELDSPGFSRFLSGMSDSARREVTFVIGGHLGLDPELLEGVDMRLALSRMTFPHELCRVMLLEQVYRACSIRSGTPYHK